jgi:hypothetical protein
VRVNLFRDRKAVNIFRDPDRVGINNLEITLFSLLWSATERPWRTGAKSAWLKIFSTPLLVSRAHCKRESIADAVCFPQQKARLATLPKQ